MKAVGILGSAALVMGTEAYRYDNYRTTGQYGTTGHYGNQYGHGGNEQHDHHDHIYGYDSIPKEKILLTTELARNTLKRDNIITQVEAANTARISYLQDVKLRKLQRLTEINTANDAEISAPFAYQLRLLQYEEDDILQALGVAVIESQEAFDDMMVRLERLRDDKIAGLDDEVEEIIEAINRAEVDQKDACDVLFSLRAEITSNITCDVGTSAAAYDAAQPNQFREYEGLFDDFNYDIGHGKGHGGDGGRQIVHIGDYETDVGARTRTTEGNLHYQRY